MIWLLVACVRPVPPALEVEPETPAPDAAEPTDPSALLGWMIGSDPLVRRPRLPTGTPPVGLDAFVAVARGASPLPQDWWALEAAKPGTLAVPFARGARLAELETSLSAPEQALPWVLPLPPPSPASGDPVRPPLAWLGDATGPALLPVVERQVLLGWLDGPDIDVTAAAHALADPTYDRAGLTPAGQLLLARGQGVHDAAAATEGMLWLEQATALAAMEAAADRDAEQAALRTLRTEIGSSRGLSGNPLGGLLTGAEERLRRDAGTNASAGGALLAQAARRWARACPDAPCGGLDRVAAMAAAGRWDPAVAHLADAWQVIALEASVDRLDAAWETSSFPLALDDIVEVLAGTGANAMDRGILQRPRPDATVVLTLSRAAGGGDLTRREDLFRLLDARIAERASAAAATAPPAIAEPLRRIAKRRTK